MRLRQQEIDRRPVSLVNRCQSLIVVNLQSAALVIKAGEHTPFCCHGFRKQAPGLISLRGNNHMIKSLTVALTIMQLYLILIRNDVLHIQSQLNIGCSS